MLHDGVGILELFVEVQERWAGAEDYGHLPRHFVDAAWANGKTSRRRNEIRRERAENRPPCPHCGGVVTRCGATAKIPKFCSSKCMRAARWARWWAKNKDVQNAARRRAAAKGGGT